jgi:hypothetical protein
MSLDALASPKKARHAERDGYIEFKTMTDPDDSYDQTIEALVAEAVDEFMERVRAGDEPAVEEYTRRWPRVGALLRNILPALRVIERSAAVDESEIPGPAGLGRDFGDFRLIRQIGRGGMGVVY